MTSDDSAVAPAALADRLPDRPLRPDEVRDIADQFEWSLFTVTYETESGTDYVPEWHVFRVTEPREGIDDDPRGDALSFWMDDDLETWDGEVSQEQLEESTWIATNEKYADYRGSEMELTGMRFEGREWELE